MPGRKSSFAGVPSGAGECYNGSMEGHLRPSVMKFDGLVDVMLNVGKNGRHRKKSPRNDDMTVEFENNKRAVDGKTVLQHTNLEILQKLEKQVRELDPRFRSAWTVDYYYDHDQYIWICVLKPLPSWGYKYA